MSMKMAKAGTDDLRMAMDLSNALEGLAHCHDPAMPQAVAKIADDEGGEYFDRDDAEQCVRALRHLLDLAERASLMRVVWAGLEAKIPRPLADWHEDIGDALWWRFPISEAPYVGTPGDSDWPGYHTHWTRIICPEAP